MAPEPDPEMTLDELLLGGSSTALSSPETDIQLINKKQRWLSALKQCVAANDLQRLTLLRSGRCRGHHIIDATSPGARISGLDRELFDRGESVGLHAARALAALALALIDEPEVAADHLHFFRSWVSRCGLEVPSAPLSSLPVAGESRHVDRIRQLAADPGLEPLTLAWMLELDGWKPAHRFGLRLPRIEARIQVLLDLGNLGQQATLRLSLLRGWSPALIPDPAMMTLGSANEAFTKSLAVAWEAAGAEHTVLWSLSDRDGPVLRVGGESLGAAFTVLLDEIRRLSRPVRGPLTVLRLRRSNAIVGRIDPARPDVMSSVSGYEAKLSVVGQSSRVVVPRSDYPSAVAAADGAPIELKAVDTWKEAASAARGIGARRSLTILAVALAAGGLTAGGLYASSASGRGADQRRAVAADLAARSLTVRGVDPALAAKLGLAAHRIDPANARAVDALRDAVADNHNVARSWQADPSRVDSIAVSETLDRVVTAGSDGHVKVWNLSSGTLIGQLAKPSRMLVAAEEQAIVASIGSDGLNTELTLLDFGADQPSELGVVAPPKCATDSSSDLIGMSFTDKDSTLVTIWGDGTVSTSDVVTRREKACWTAKQVLEPLTFPERLPANPVMDAQVLERDDGVDEAVLLLSNNDVISSRLGAHSAKMEVPRAKTTGDALLIAASDETVSVATKHGVAVWDRADKSLLTNPAGGLNVEPRTLADAHGHLLISGDAGTAVVQVGNPDWVMPKSLNALSGGSATVAAINARAVVAGGPGGRISVLADSAGALTAERNTKTTGLDFLPDGRLLVTEAVTWLVTGTRSQALNLLDPGEGTQDTALETWTYGKDRQPFYANDIAAGPGVVAAAGLTEQGGTVLAWSGDDHESPHRLLLPPPNDRKLEEVLRIIVNVAITDDGKYLVARHISGQVGIWTTADWKLTGTVDLVPGNPRMAIVGDQAIFVNGRDAKAELVGVDLASRTITHRVAAPDIALLSTNASGSLVVTLTDDGNLQTRGADLRVTGTDWRPAATGDPATDIVLDRAGVRMAVTQGDQVFVYDWASRTLAMPPLTANGDRVVRVAWSPDGKTLAGTAMPPVRGDKTVGPLLLWNTGELDWTAQVCRWTGGGLSRAEWTQYVGSKVPFIDLCPGGN